MSVRVIASLFCLALVLGCSGKEPGDAKKTLTREQKDSVLAESDLPGAKVVGKAIAVSDSAAARAKRLNEKTK